MSIVLNTAPINVKDSDGNYVTLNTFSMDSLDNIRNQTLNSIAEINSATASKVADIDTAKTEAISAINEAVSDAVDEALNDESNGALKQIDDAKNNAINDLKLFKVEINAYNGPTISKAVSGMTEDMVLINYVISDPTLLATDLTINTSNDNVTISGLTINSNNSVDLILYFLPLKENEEE